MPNNSVTDDHISLKCGVHVFCNVHYIVCVFKEIHSIRITSGTALQNTQLAATLLYAVLRD